MLLTDVSLKRRTVVAVLIVLIVAAGVSSYINLPRESTPDIPLARILITTAYEGISPEDIESSVTIKIENELTGLKGLKEIRSVSAEGISMIDVEFVSDIAVEDALQYVRDRVDLAKPELPSDAEEPALKEINIAEFPIALINISGSISPVRLKVIADDLEDAIEQIPGVLNVDVLGALEREIRIEIDPDRLASYNLTIPELLALVPSENVNISAGALETAGTTFNVRVPAEFEKPAEIERLVLAVRDDKPIYLADVATICDTFKDRTTFSRLDRVDSITISIQKRIGANVIHISDSIKEIVAEARKLAPAGVTFDITFDKSKYIRIMISDLENNIACGLILVLAVLLLFIGGRTSAIVAAAIPMSMLISFAVISLLGYTLNMVVLFSLVLALGMLVDNAIVIVENIYRHVQLGYGRMEAALLGTREVAWPVATSTATTVAAFFPLMFWPGIMGSFMKYLPITLIITLTSSLFVALVISPTICSVAAGGKQKQKSDSTWLVRSYRGLLELILGHWTARVFTLWMSACLLLAMGLLYIGFGKGVEFFPIPDPDRAIINIRSPQGTSRNESDRLARIVEKRVEKYRGDLRYVITNVGSSGAGLSFGASAGGPHIANLTLVFHDYAVRSRPSADAVKEIRRDLSDIAGAEIKVEKEKMGPPAGAPITVRLIGKDFKVIEGLSKKAKQMIATVPGLINLRSDYEAARPELSFVPDRRRAKLLRADTAVVGQFLKMAIFGLKVGVFREYNDEYDITVRLPLSKRTNIEDLLSLQIPNAIGRAVPLSSVGTFDYRGGFGTINRIDQKRVVTLTADVEGRLGDAVLKDTQQRLEQLELPVGYTLQYAGEKEEMDKAAAFLMKAFIYAVLLIVMILVAQFNSLTVPFIIMATVVLSLVGVLTGLLVCGLPFGVLMTGIGVISLAGVVVNNAIVLLDYTRQLEQRGMKLIEAAVEAGKTRLRPVLLTATTTILGLIPMATGVSFDFHLDKLQWVTRSQSSEWWRTMAIAVIFGLAFATLLTLVVVPTLYVSLARIAEWFGIKKPEDRPPPRTTTS